MPAWVATLDDGFPCGNSDHAFALRGWAGEPATESGAGDPPDRPRPEPGDIPLPDVVVEALAEHLRRFPASPEGSLERDITALRDQTRSSSEATRFLA